MNGLKSLYDRLLGWHIFSGRMSYNIPDFVKRCAVDNSQYHSTSNDLLGYMKKAMSLQEPEARDLVMKLITDIEYLHGKWAEKEKEFHTLNQALSQAIADYERDKKALEEQEKEKTT